MPAIFNAFQLLTALLKRPPRVVADYSAKIVCTNSSLIAASSLIAVLCVFVGGCSTTQFLFFPAKGYLRTPDQLGIRYQQISHRAKDGVALESWYLHAKDDPQGVVYFLHGNAENISTHIGSVYWLPAAGYDVFMLDYRGFGLSEGLAKIPQVFLDIDSGFRWIQSHNPDQLPVFIVAQSLGASLAIPFAADPETRSKINGLAIDAAFTTYADIARYAFSQHWLTWLFQYPASWSVSNPYNPIDFIELISPTPILIFHSKEDTVIPFRNADLLYQQAAQPKYFFQTEGPHIATFKQAAARERLLKFMRSNSDTVESQ